MLQKSEQKCSTGGKRTKTWINSHKNTCLGRLWKSFLMLSRNVQELFNWSVRKQRRGNSSHEALFWDMAIDPWDEHGMLHLDYASPPASFSVSRDNSSSLSLGLCEDTYIKRHWNTRYYNDKGGLRMKVWRDWMTCPKMKHYCLMVDRGTRAGSQSKPLATKQSKQG